MRAIRFAVRTP